MSRVFRAALHFLAVLFAVVLIRALVVFYADLWRMGR
jgi:hypothetical protein